MDMLFFQSDDYCETSSTFNVVFEEDDLFLLS